MNDDKRTARIVGLSLAAICSVCFALSALGMSSDPRAAEARSLASQAEFAPIVLVNQTAPVAPTEAQVP
jgi:hypothetical protein